MEMAYIQAENLKHKRTFTKTLIVLAPFVTALMNFFAPLWFQLNSYNWWYILLYPGFLTLTCALIEQRDKFKAVLLVSFELDEILNVSDRIAVIHAGEIVGVVDPKETSENELGLLMAGYTLEEARKELEKGAGAHE